MEDMGGHDEYDPERRIQRGAEPGPQENLGKELWVYEKWDGIDHGATG